MLRLEVLPLLMWLGPMLMKDAFCQARLEQRMAVHM